MRRKSVLHAQHGKPATGLAYRQRAWSIVRQISVSAMLCTSAALFADDTPPARPEQKKHSAAQEISALIRTLEQSACQFQRNGDWHSASKAAAHLQRKYQALQQRATVNSAEQFIEQAATRSSLSGEPYQVQCPGQAQQGSREWLLMQLQALRSGPTG